MLSLGTYPDVSLSEARNRRETTRSTLALGTDPSAERKATKETQKNTFEGVANHWLAGLARQVRGNRRSESTLNKAKWLLESYIFPDLGQRPIGSITAPELLVVLKKIETQGLRETARRAKQKCGQVFRHSIGLGYAQRDITLDLRGLLEAPIVTHHASITDPREVGVQHIVPLSHQALAILRELETLTGNGRYLFPALGDPDRTMSENTINHALRTLGFEGDEMTGHGFRSIASTLLNEQGCWTADAIERQLSHGERDSVRAAYNYAEYLPERQQMMQAWADYLDDLREGRKTARQQKALSTALPNRETSEQRVA